MPSRPALPSGSFDNRRAEHHVQITELDASDGMFGCSTLEPVIASRRACEPNGYLLAPNSGDYNLDGTSLRRSESSTQNFTGSHSKSAYINGLFTAATFRNPLRHRRQRTQEHLSQSGHVPVGCQRAEKQPHPLVWRARQSTTSLRFHQRVQSSESGLGGSQHGRWASAKSSTLHPRRGSCSWG